MVTLNAHFDGKTIVPDEPVSFPTNQKLRITIEAIEQPIQQPIQQPIDQPIEPAAIFSPHADPAAALMVGEPFDERDALHIDPLFAVPADFVRQPGSGAGEIHLSDDFDETPDGFKDYL